jgi:hypothetical protein
MLKSLSRLALAAAFSAAAATASAADDVAKLAREANDRAEIEALMWRYVRALDTLDVDAYVALFTEDAQFGNAKGREGIRALIAGIKAAREKNTPAGKPVTPTYQTMSNVTIEFPSENRARLQAYYMAVLAPVDNMPPRVATVGREDDELVKVDGRWLIHVRNVNP